MKKQVYQEKKENCDMDKRLDNISLIANEILESARKTNDILTYQNDKLDKIEEKVHDTENKIISANRTLKKMLSDKNISFINGLSTGAILGGITIGTIGISLGSLPIVGVSLAVTGVVATGTLALNKVNSTMFK